MVFVPLFLHNTLLTFFWPAWDHSHRIQNVTFKREKYLASSVKSETVCIEEMVFQLQLLEKAYFIIKMTGATMVWPGCSVLIEKHPESTWTLFAKARRKTLTLLRPGGGRFWVPPLAKKMNKLNWQFRLYHIYWATFPLIYPGTF